MKQLGSLLNSNLVNMCIEHGNRSKKLSMVSDLIKNFCIKNDFTLFKSDIEIHEYVVSNIFDISKNMNDIQDFSKDEIKLIFDDNKEEISSIILQKFNKSIIKKPVKIRKNVVTLNPVNNESWRNHNDFIYNKKGKLDATPSNLKAVFKYHPKLNNLYRLNILTDEVEHNYDVFDRLPYDKEFRKEFLEKDIGHLWAYINDEMYGVDFKRKDIQDMVNFISENNKYHPIKNFIESKVWDGVKRLDNFSINYFSSPSECFYREAVRLHLIACVARIYNPGIKYDHVLILKGKQGIGKSYSLNILGREWFKAFSYDEFKRISPEDRSSLIAKSWIVNFDEIHKDMLDETFKKLITEQSDDFRAKWHKKAKLYRRNCIFFATTDKEKFLKHGQDTERRFFVIPCNKIDVEGIEYDQQQIWAEAKVNWDNSDKRLILSDDLRGEQMKINKNFTEFNSFDDFISSELHILIQIAIEEGKQFNFPDQCFELKTLINLFIDKFPKEIKNQSYELLMKRFSTILIDDFHATQTRKCIGYIDYRFWKI